MGTIGWIDRIQAGNDTTRRRKPINRTERERERERDTVVAQK